MVVWTSNNMTTTISSAVQNIGSDSWNCYAYSADVATTGTITITGKMALETGGTHSVIGLNDGATNTNEGYNADVSFRVDSPANKVDVKKLNTDVVTGITFPAGATFKVIYSWTTGKATFFINDVEVAGSETALSPTSLNGYVSGYGDGAGATSVTVTVPTPSISGTFFPPPIARIRL